MDNARINCIREAFNYNRQEVLHLDLFDPDTDSDIINELALSKTACELETPKDELRKLLSL